MPGYIVRIRGKMMKDKNEPLIFMSKSKNFALWNWNKMPEHKCSEFKFLSIKISSKELEIILLNFEISFGSRYNS